MPIRNTTRGTVLAEKASVADTPGARMKGLLGRKCLAGDEALVITRCQSVHMVFMQFAIDVVFVDAGKKVVGLSKNLKPFEFSPIFWKSACAIELAAGTIEKTKTQLGDQMDIQ